MINKDDFEIGNHELLAKMTIVGEACDDVIIEKENVFYIPSNGTISERHGDFYIDYNYTTKGEELIVTPELLTNRSTEGCIIDKVDYYWDGKLISTATSFPYELRYRIEEENGTSHQLKAIIAYHDNYSNNLTYNWSHSNYIVQTADEYFVSWDIKSSRNDYTNGETISMIAKLYKGSNVNKSFKIEIYFDDLLIGKSVSFPYLLDYQLNNLKVGTHTIKGVFTTKEGDSYSSQITEEKIIITK